MGATPLRSIAGTYSEMRRVFLSLVSALTSALPECW